MLLIVFGVAFDRLVMTEARKLLLAWLLVIGSVMFPLGVLLQTLDWLSSRWRQSRRLCA